MMIFCFHLLLVTVLLGVANGDPYNDYYMGYVFTFHEDTDLILAIKDTNCYFVAISDLRAVNLYVPTPGITMDNVLELLDSSRPGHVTAATPGSMHSMFHDEYADALCEDKQHYLVTVGVTSTPIPDVTFTAPTTPITPTAATATTITLAPSTAMQSTAMRTPPALTTTTFNTGTTSSFNTGTPMTFNTGTTSTFYTGSPMTFMTGTTSPTPEPCQDIVPNCHQYRDEGCRGIFENWARAHCPVFCKYCTPSVTSPPLPCQDNNPECARYNADICTNDAYYDWVQENCRQFCNRC